MAKLINSPKECAYKSLVADKYFCNYPDFKLRYCTWTNTFPSGCPLQDGISKKDLITIGNDNIPLIPKNSTDTVDKIIKRLKKRNRKDCIFGYYPFNRIEKITILHCKHIDIPFPHCQGVNCGKFESKKNIQK